MLWGKNLVCVSVCVPAGAHVCVLVWHFCLYALVCLGCMCGCVSCVRVCALVSRMHACACVPPAPGGPWSPLNPGLSSGLGCNFPGSRALLPSRASWSIFIFQVFLRRERYIFDVACEKSLPNSKPALAFIDFLNSFSYFYFTDFLSGFCFLFCILLIQYIVSPLHPLS